MKTVVRYLKYIVSQDAPVTIEHGDNTTITVLDVMPHGPDLLYVCAALTREDS